MPLPDRRQKCLRLLPEEDQRLGKAARSRGKNEQDFMKDAVMSAVLDEEQRAGYRERQREGRDGRRADLEPVGLGLRRAAAQMSPSAPPAAPQGVVVNVGPQPGGLTAKLAAWIGAAPSYEQDVRLRQAVEILGGSEEEKEAHAAQLQAAVAGKKAEPRSSGLGRLLRADLGGLEGLKELLKI